MKPSKSAAKQQKNFDKEEFKNDIIKEFRVEIDKRFSTPQKGVNNTHEDLIQLAKLFGEKVEKKFPTDKLVKYGLLFGISSYAFYKVLTLEQVNVVLSWLKYIIDSGVFVGKKVKSGFHGIKNWFFPDATNNEQIYFEVKKHRDDSLQVIKDIILSCQQYLGKSTDLFLENLKFFLYHTNPKCAAALCNQFNERVDNKQIEECKRDVMILYDYLHLNYPEIFNYFQDHQRLFDSILISNLDYNDFIKTPYIQYEPVDDYYQEILGVPYNRQAIVTRDTKNFAYPYTYRYLPQNKNFTGFLTAQQDDYYNMKNGMTVFNNRAQIDDTSDFNILISAFLFIGLFLCRILFKGGFNFFGNLFKKKEPINLLPVKKNESDKQLERISPYTNDYLEDMKLLGYDPFSYSVDIPDIESNENNDNDNDNDKDKNSNDNNQV